MAKMLTEAQFKKVIADCRMVALDFSADGMDFTDDVAFDSARALLDDTPGLKEYIVKKIGARDYEGWLANQF